LFVGIKYHELGIKDNSRHPEWRTLIQFQRKQEAGARQLCQDVQNYRLIRRQQLQETGLQMEDESQATFARRQGSERVRRFLRQMELFRLQMKIVKEL